MPLLRRAEQLAAWTASQGDSVPLTTISYVLYSRVIGKALKGHVYAARGRTLDECNCQHL